MIKTGDIIKLSEAGVDVYCEGKVSGMRATKWRSARWTVIKGEEDEDSYRLITIQRNDIKVNPIDFGIPWEFEKI